MNTFLTWVGLMFASLAPLGLANENWSQFRGPNCSGVAESATPPLAFGPDKNVSWRTAAPDGVSSPIVWGNRIFLTGVADGQLVTLAYDVVTGRELWRQAVSAEQLESCHAFSSPAASTPCTDGQRVYVYFNSFGVLAYDFTGREVWRRPLPMLPVQYGSASSPVLIGGRLIVQRDGRAANSHLLALDPTTGRTVWDIARPLARDSHSTPMLWRHDGIEELMVLGRGALTAHDPATGQPKWWVSGWGNSAIATAVAGDGLLFTGSKGMGDPSEPAPRELNWDFLTSAYDANKDGNLAIEEVPETAFWQIRAEVPKETAGNMMKIRALLKYADADKNAIVTKEEWSAFTASTLGRGNSDRFVAIRPGARDDATDTHVAWETTKGLNEMPSPLYYRGYVYVIADGGRLSAFRAKSGERVIDREPVGASGQYVGSPIAANGFILLTSERGMVTILRTGEKLDVVARNSLAEGVRSTPALVGKTLVVRTKDQLWAVAE
ncbi:MAG: PQQ-binding-like beta-propeller repeat protein [Opitutaceae bacterium]